VQETLIGKAACGKTGGFGGDRFGSEHGKFLPLKPRFCMIIMQQITRARKNRTKY
jgi:hypothetical protein